MLRVSRSTVLSLVLHGTVLGLLLWGRSTEPSPEIIVPAVDLVADPAAAAEAVDAAPTGPSLPASSPAAAAPGDPAPPEPQTTPRHRATPAAAQKPRAHRAMPAPPAPAALEKAAAVEPAPPSAATASASSDGAASAPAAPSAADAETSGGGSGDHAEAAGAPGDVLNAYLAEIRRKIQRALVYPAAARRLGLTGRVDLAFRIESDGTVPADGLRVVGGSDEDLLRDGAIATIRDIGGFHPPPGGSLRLVVPVVFTLIGTR